MKAEIECYGLKRLAIWILVIKAVCVLGMIYAGLGLMPDEAQYWTWSKSLSYGYYSKPPAIAWQIAAGCAIFGDSEFGVRFFSAVLSFFLSLSIYFLSRSAGLEKKWSFWSAITFSLTPLGVISSILATTDCGFVLFWTLAAALFAKPLLEGKDPQFLKIGLLIGIGALFKWAIFLLWIPILIFSIYKRFSLLNFFAGFFISLIALVPSIIWNAQHDWATFKHVLKSVTVEGSKKGGNPGNFLAAQVALASPFILLLIVAALIDLGWKLKKIPSSLAFYWWTSVGLFLAIFSLSIFKKVQGNWAICVYPTAFPLLFAFVAMRKESFMRYVKIAIGFSVLLIALLFFIPYLQTNDSLPFKLPYKMTPWKGGLGWKQMEKGLLQAGYNPNENFLFSDRYQITSLLSFYGPEKKRAYFLNLQNLRKNQFSYWKGLEDEQMGKTGYFVVIVDGDGALKKAITVQKKLKTTLKDYFKDVSSPFIIIPLLEIKNDVVKAAVLIRCEDYNGKVTEVSEKY